MPGSSFRGLQESFINYGKNTSPELITCMHEEISVAMAHGYAKIEGKPMLTSSTARSGCSTRRWRSTTPIATACRSTSSPATSPTRPCAGPASNRSHRAGRRRDRSRFHQMGRLCRPRCSISPNRRCAPIKIAMTPPMGPVLLVADSGLQEDPIPEDAKLRHSEAAALSRRRKAMRARSRSWRSCWSRPRIR